MQTDLKLQTGRLTWQRAARNLFVLLLALIAMIAVALTLGSEHIPIAKMFSSAMTREQAIILYDIRIPRMALALATGAALAMAGAAFQALLRNPLADPYVLGVSSGAALGAVTGIIFFSGAGFSRPLLSFAGAGLATLFVYRLGRRGEEPARLILAGVVVSTLLSSIIMLISSLVDDIKLRNITFWLLGDLSAGNTDTFWVLCGVVVVAGTALILKSRALNLMMTGERDAFSLGVETSQVRWIVFTAASLLTAAAVSAGGAIGFVGLVIPHLIRLSSGSDNRLVIPASAITGALFVLLADTGARTVIAPRELPTGAILALIGAPVLGYLLVGRRFRKIRAVDAPATPKAPPKPRKREVSGPVLTLKSVSFSYDREVLSNLDLEIRAGEIFALLGPNGAGKSTVLGVAAGRLTPRSGSVLLQQTPIAAFSRREIGRKLAVVAQAGELEFPMTVLEYVLTGRYAHATGTGFDSGRDVDAAIEGLSAMDSLHLANRPFNQLSSGERQRVTVARALAQEPLALLLDEPTAHLDLTHQLTLLDLVHRMACEQQIGALLVTHEIHLARRFADRAALLKNGRIIACGNPSDVLTRAALAGLYSVPQKFEDLI